MGSEWILGRLAWGVWIGFDWLRIGTGGELLWIRRWTFGFLLHRIRYMRLDRIHETIVNITYSPELHTDRGLGPVFQMVAHPHYPSHPTGWAVDGLHIENTRSVVKPSNEVLLCWPLEAWFTSPCYCKHC
jgi:hypothetical protein